MKKYFAAIVVFTLFTSCYHAHPIVTLKNAQKIPERTLFVALDGVDFALIDELCREGHFKDFLPPLKFTSTFPSDTTLGFTGIFQPLGAGRVPGYEVRFYSYQKNKIEGGTPFDIYKIEIPYKDYFDAFRHRMREKATMYMLPGVAGKEDLVRTEKILYKSDKKILMNYLGGTDGAAHILGRARAKHFLIYADQFLHNMVTRYEKERHEKLRVVLFSDHGFYYQAPKTVTNKSLQARLGAKGFQLTSRVTSDRDVVVVPFGLLSAGILFTPVTHRAEMAQAIAGAAGVDLVFWHSDKRDKVFMKGHDGSAAYFEYAGSKRYRYVSVTGDPLGYNAVLQRHGLAPQTWLNDATWQKLTYDDKYPDAGYRLYDSFFNLVENPASILFSMEPGYQFGSLLARLGTYAKFGHKGTHGGLFRETTQGIILTNTQPDKALPKFMRYNEMFPYFLTPVTTAYPATKLPEEVSVILTPEQRQKLPNR